MHGRAVDKITEVAPNKHVIFSDTRAKELVMLLLVRPEELAGGTVKPCREINVI